MYCYMLCFLVVFSSICGSECITYEFEIIRSEQDMFRRWKCYHDISGSTSETSKECFPDHQQPCFNVNNAECVNTSTCEYCRCLNGHNTFMISEYYPNHGECKRDEDIVAISAPNEDFLLENKKDHICVKSSANNQFVIETICQWHRPYLKDMAWIFSASSTSGQEKKLLINVKTLKCVVSQGTNKKLIMKQCQKGSDRQEILCTRQYSKYSQYTMKIQWQGNGFLFLRNSGYAISSNNSNNRAYWRAFENHCEKNINYAGCYRFSDGSFMKYLNYSEMNPKLQISAPIFKENDKGCKVMEMIEYIRDGWTWETTVCNRSLFSITKENSFTKVLTIKSMESLEQWNGSLVKLYVSCKEEEHCVLLKLKSLFRKYPPEVPPTSPTHTQKSTDYDDTTHTNTDYSGSGTNTDFSGSSTNTDYSGSSTAAPFTSKPTKKRKETPSVTSTTENSNHGLSEESSGKENSTVIPVVATITLLLVALALVIGFLVYYRRKKRAQVPQNNTNNHGVVNYAKEIYEDPDRIYEGIKENGTSTQVAPANSDTGSGLITNAMSPEYETLKENGNEVPFNRPGNFSGSNTHPHGNSNVNNDIPRKLKETKIAPHKGAAVYETLEQPPSDNFYNYIDNSKIENPLASPELEYTYSKDHDLPKNPQQTKTAPQVPAVYETLENPYSDDVYNYIDNTNIANPATSEQEYSYATDTTLPRTSKHEKREPSAKDAVYHTLEQEQPLPSSSNIPSELEYSYAKTTDLPRKPATNDDEYSYATENTQMPSVGVNQTNTGSCAPPTNNALYHTLEESNPPQVPVYSTLEEGDAENANAGNG